MKKSVKKSAAVKAATWPASEGSIWLMTVRASPQPSVFQAQTPRTHCTAALIVECRCYDADKTYHFVLHKTASCSALPTYFPGVEFPRLTALKLQYSRYKIKCRILYIFLGRRVLEKEKSLSCEACIGH